jgi:hypothetical protein
MVKKILVIPLLLVTVLYTIPGRGSRDNALYDDIIEYKDSILYLTLSRRKHRISNRYLSNIPAVFLYENKNTICIFHLLVAGEKRNEFYSQYDDETIDIIFFNVPKMPDRILLQGAPVFIEIYLNIEDIDTIKIEDISAGHIL